MAYSVEIRSIPEDVEPMQKFIFFEAEVPNATWGLSVKRFKFEEPDGDGTNNLSINLGVEKTISFPFKLLKSTEDASDGTYVTVVKTIEEKVEYLIGEKSTDGVTDVQSPFLKTGVESFFFVDIKSHTGEWLNNKVQLDSVNFNPSNNNPESLTGYISFTIGGGRQ